MDIALGKSSFHDELATTASVKSETPLDSYDM